MLLPPNDIPITDKLIDFKAYLSSNDRVIFSARFGDGKSTFLNEFIEDNRYSSGYKFFTIHPLNYQVAENKDIFEYIKRDILTQQMSYADLPEAVYDESLMLQMYMMNNIGGITSDAVDAIPDINIWGVSTNAVKKGLQFLRSNIKRYKEYKEKLREEYDTSKAEAFLESFESKDGFIYEFDFISQLICNINRSISSPTEEGATAYKTCLIIEDLDRMDPAHIFRILNILSAHIDRPHRGATETCSKQAENKFAFDKIILVCHYENIESIFHHIYGETTDFKGYISKFSSSTPFYFSLRKSFREYLCWNVGEDLRQYPSVLDFVAYLILKGGKGSLSLRDIAKKIESVNNPSLITKEYFTIGFDHKLRGLNPLTKLLILLAQFDIPYNHFVENIPDEVRSEFYSLVGVCWLVSINEAGVGHKSGGGFLLHIQNYDFSFNFDCNVEDDKIVTSLKGSSWWDSQYSKAFVSLLPSIIEYLQQYICIKNKPATL